ncbi:MAG TPA: hypothetical protein VFV70_00840 [Hyphomonadaceae bacterium]|nr:hypothetical protein [Hyphomonadaceae bacterium]
MRVILPIASAAVLAAPAIAQESTTLQYVTTKSVVMKVAGMEIPVSYKPDGTFSAMDGQVTGKWKIVGETMCSSSNMDPNETCITYPAGKKPGDEFEVISPQGPFSVLINK